MSTYASLTNPANLTFDDEFDSFVSSPDGSVGWMTTYPYEGPSSRALPTGGQATYNSDSSVGVNPFSDTNGVLSITAAPETPSAANDYQPYSSGVMTTFYSFAQQWGYFEIDAKLPQGAGLWAAFFMLTDSEIYTAELDVLENLGQNTAYTESFIHVYDNGTWYSDNSYFKVPDLYTAFHTFGVDWEPVTTTLYLDGVAVATEPTLPAMNNPMYIILTLAVGGNPSWAGPPNSSTVFPASFQINYVRAYATANTIGVEGTEAIKTSAITGQVLLGSAAEAGVTVSLLDAAGSVIATATSMANGSFSFSTLAAGDYQVMYTPPSGQVLEAAGGQAADAVTTLTPVLNLVDGQTLSLASQALVAVSASSTLSGQVEFFGKGQPGVAVALLNGTGTVVATTTTGSLGTFTFTGLVAGSYQVLYTPPPGETVLAVGQVDPSTGLTPLLTVGSVASKLTLPTAQFGGPLSTISGDVLYAAVGEAGVGVALLDASGDLVSTTSTAADGSYSFTGVVAGSYTVQFTPPALQTTATASVAAVVTAGQALVLAPATLTPTPGSLSGTVTAAGVGAAGVIVTLSLVGYPSMGSTTTNANGQFTFTGLAPGVYTLKYSVPTGSPTTTAMQLDVAVNSSGVTPPITLAAGQAITVPTEALLTNAGAIAGKTLHFGGATDPSYGGVDGGVSVTLLDANGHVIATAVSNSAGFYEFTGIAAGQYQVQYTAPLGQAFKAGQSSITPLFSVAAGKTTNPPSAELVSVTGIEGQVLLAGAGAAGVVVSLVGTSLSATTGVNGDFTFSGLTPGSYQVQYTLPSSDVLQSLPGGTISGGTGGTSETITLAAGASVTLPTATVAAASACITGSVLFGGSFQPGVTVRLLGATTTVVATATTDQNGVYTFSGVAGGTYRLEFADVGETVQAGGPASVGTGLTQPITVAAGQTLTVAPQTLVAATASLSGSVDLAGIGLSGAGVTLWSGGQAVQQTTTGGGGTFTFSALSAGLYSLQFTAPSGVVLEAGSLADASSGMTQPVTLTAGEALIVPEELLDAAPATISGSVVLGGLGEAGTTVDLLTQSGDLVSSTTSGSDGKFSLIDLAAGTYVLSFTPPSGALLAPGSLADAGTGLTGPITVVPGQTSTLAPESLIPAPATLSGSVVMAGAAQPGITVVLLEAGGASTTATTDANGDFSFTGLAAGTYQVQYDAPTGEVVVGASDLTPTVGLSASQVLTPGQMVNLPAAVLAAAATISGSVVFGGVGQSGVGVTLLDAAGNSVATAATDTSGDYAFIGLAAGSYQVKITPPASELLSPGGLADPTSGLTAVQTVVAGQSWGLGAETLIPATAILTGSVLLGGVGQAAVAVVLLGSAGQAGTTTAADGSFSFTGIVAGTYQLRVTAPTGKVVQGAGDLSPAVLTSTLTLLPGEATSVNAVLLPAASITGSVVFGGVGQAGIGVTLVDAAGLTVATTTSASHGTYSFAGLAAGSYQVQFTPPTTEAATTLTATVTAGQALALPTENLVVAPASISGTVTLNGAAEAGVAVTLINSFGKTAATTTTTGSSGAFSFTGLAAGSYVVKYSAPAGVVLQLGSLASVTTGQTGWESVTAGQTLALPAEAMLTNPAMISGKVLHFGAPTDPAYGSGEQNVTVSLLSGGNVVATASTLNTGYYAFTDVAPGTYQVLFTAPSGQTIEPGTAGETAAFTLAAGQSYSANASMMTALTLTGTGTSLTPAAGAYVVTGNASNSTLTLGAGNQFVTLTGTANTVVTGSGNQTINLSGSGNSITVGSGTSTISAGTGNDIVHAAGGNVTISATGGGNLFDSGAGMSFLNADGSANNIFMLNAAASGTLTTITGFNTAAGDILDLKRTLAGTAILPSLATIGSTITSSIAGSNTDLYYTTTGTHPTSTEFAVLVGVHTTVAQLQAAMAFSLN